jgi:hypothetical protein
MLSASRPSVLAALRSLLSADRNRPDALEFVVSSPIFEEVSEVAKPGVVIRFKFV